MTRPYVLLSCAMSIDGYIDAADGERLLLSDEPDLDRVDEVRASCDAIMVGAGTIRADDPRLLLRSQARRLARMARGIPADPARVTLTGTGDLDPAARFFRTRDTARILYVASKAFGNATNRFGELADVVDAGDPVDLGRVLDDLGERGIARLMVEGGTSVHTQFLTERLADELQLAIAPIFVGDSAAPRFVGSGAFPWKPGQPAHLAEVSTIGDMALLRYALSDRFVG